MHVLALKKGIIGIEKKNYLSGPSNMLDRKASGVCH